MSKRKRKPMPSDLCEVYERLGMKAPQDEVRRKKDRQTRNQRKHKPKGQR